MDTGFWQHHGLLFLVGITLFPRLTMLVAVPGPFSLLAWLGWAFAPHFLVAFLATSLYWQTNPVLCVIAWAVAFGGTGGEGYTTRRFIFRRGKGKGS